MRAEDKPLDLNNLPDDFSSKDGKQASEGSSSSGGAAGGGAAGGGEEESGGKEGKEEKGKVYECRFCSLKFCKSQALGGHMNRHRQERETESLNRARQLLFGNDALPHRLGAYHPGSHVNVSDPILAFRSESSSVYPPPLLPPPGRLFSGSPIASSSPLLQPYVYQSPPRQLAPYSSSLYNLSNDFASSSHGLTNRANQYLGLHGTTTHGYTSGMAGGSSDSSTNYTCIGAPVGEVLGRRKNHKEGLIWGRSSIDPAHQNPSSVVMKGFQDGL